MDGLALTSLTGPAIDDRPVEVVERKGKGHPDSICDALAEEASQALLRYYVEHFGFALHYNVDKALLWAGVAEPAFGGGEVVHPMRIWLAGRASMEIDGARVPAPELVLDAAQAWLAANLHGLDPQRHAEVRPLLRPGSRELVELFRRQHERGEVLANDTSAGVGFAPLSDLERVVLEVERELTAAQTIAAHPAIGEDVKLMGVRRGERIDLTVACALIGRYLPDLAAYLDAKELVAEIVRNAAARVTSRPVDATVNAGDAPERESVYLTVTGTSAEAGDDGQAGRGNRATGLITPGRPMVLESVAGKNPVSHTGKVYAVGAQLLAEDLVAGIPAIAEAQCLLVSRIGAPIDRPFLVDVGIRTRGDREPESLRADVDEIVQARLAGLPALWKDLLAGRVTALEAASAETPPGHRSPDDSS